MSLNAKFSLTPVEPLKYLWDQTNSQFRYYAYIVHYGAYIGTGGYSLEGSYNNNWVNLSSNNVGYPFPDPFLVDYYERALAYLTFKTDALADKQYLLLFHVRSYDKIGIYLNGNLIWEENCDGDETIAVLVDCPGPDIWDTLYVVPNNYAMMKGVDCYVL